MIDKRVTVIVAEAEADCSDCSDGCEKEAWLSKFEQTVYSFESLLTADWFLEMLRSRGFYTLDEIASTKYEYLDKYVYRYGTTYKYYTEKLTEVYPHQCEDLHVYQEVLGPERLKAVGKVLDKRKQYEKKEAAIKAKQLDTAAKQKEKLRLKKIERAKALLAEENI